MKVINPTKLYILCLQTVAPKGPVWATTMQMPQANTLLLYILIMYQSYVPNLVKIQQGCSVV